jgi:hypothetical protein
MTGKKLPWKKIDAYLSRFSSTLPPSYNELASIIPGEAESYRNDLALHATWDFEVGDDTPEHAIKAVNGMVPSFIVDDRTGATVLGKRGLMDSVKSRSVLSFFAGGNVDPRRNDHLQSTLFDSIEGSFPGHAGTTRHALQSNLVREWIEHGRDIADASVTGFAITAKLEPWVVTLMRAFNREPAMIDAITKRERSPADVNEVAIDEIFALLSSSDKAKKKKGNELGYNILEKGNLDLWSGIARAGTGSVSRDAIYQLANSPGREADPGFAGTRVSTFEAILQGSDERPKKFVVDAYDTWDAPATGDDCAILKTLATGSDGKLATAATRVAKEKCPGEYLGIVSGALKSSSIEDAKNMIVDLLSLHPYATTKITKVKDIIDGIAKNGKYNAKKGLLHAMAAGLTTVDVCDAIATIEKDPDPGITGGMYGTKNDGTSLMSVAGIKKKMRC